MSNLFDQLRTQVQADLDAMHPGGSLELGCQEYPGPLIIRRSMVVEGNGATIWALTGPVLIVEPGAKVQLKNLRVEVTGEDAMMSPAEEVAIDVRAGSDLDLEDVEVRGKIDGLAMEDAGFWRYPKTLYLGQVQSSTEHEFRVRIATAAACRISSEVSGVEVSPSVLPGGPVELRINVDRLRNDTYLYGRILLKTGLSKRWIVISGQVMDNPVQAATQGGPTMLWEPHDWAMLLTAPVSASIPSPSIPSPSIPSPSIPSPSIPSPSIPSPSIPSPSIPSPSIPSPSIPSPSIPSPSIPSPSIPSPSIPSPSIPSPSIPSPSIPSSSIPTPSIPTPSIPSPSIPSPSIPSPSIPSPSIPIPGLPTSSVPLTSIVASTPPPPIQISVAPPSNVSAPGTVTERHSLRHQDPTNLGIFAPKSSVPMNTTSTPVSPPAASTAPVAPAPWLNQPLNIAPAPSFASPTPTPPQTPLPTTPIAISLAPPAPVLNSPAKPAAQKPLINSLFTKPLSTPVTPPSTAPATPVAPENTPSPPDERPVAKDTPQIPKWAQKSTPIVPPPK